MPDGRTWLTDDQRRDALILRFLGHFGRDPVFMADLESRIGSLGRFPGSRHWFMVSPEVAEFAAFWRLDRFGGRAPGVDTTVSPDTNPVVAEVVGAVAAWRAEAADAWRPGMSRAIFDEDWPPGLVHLANWWVVHTAAGGRPVPFPLPDLPPDPVPFGEPVVMRAADALTARDRARLAILPEDAPDADLLVGGLVPVVHWPPDDTWHPSTESRGDAQQRLLSTARHAIQEELDRIEREAREAGLESELAPGEDDHLRWLWLRVRPPGMAWAEVAAVVDHGAQRDEAVDPESIQRGARRVADRIGYVLPTIRGRRTRR